MICPKPGTGYANYEKQEDKPFISKYYGNDFFGIKSVTVILIPHLIRIIWGKLKIITSILNAMVIVITFLY